MTKETINKVQDKRIKSIVESLYELEQNIFELDYKLQLKTYGDVGKKEEIKRVKKKVRYLYEELGKIIDEVNKI